MKALKQFEVWSVVGSQEMYGTEVLRRVEEHGRAIADSLDAEAPAHVRGRLAIPPDPRPRTGVSESPLWLLASALVVFAAGIAVIVLTY